MHVPAFLHVENVARVDQSLEVEDPEEVYQEEQQEPVEEQFLEADFANPESQQSKPRFIDPI